jgi:hypothetical protein
VTLLAGKTGRNLVRYSAAAVLGLVLISASVQGADPGPVAGDRVAVLDAGTFLRVEAHHATLGEVLDQLKARLKIRVTHSELLDLSRGVDGSKAGTPKEIVQWLAPGASFILIYDEPKPGQPKLQKLERIGFLSSGTAAPGTAAPGTAVPGTAVPPARVPAGAASAPSVMASESLTGTVSTAASGGAPGSQGGTAALSTETANPNEELKPAVPPSTPKSEVMGVADQLRALTPDAQLAIEQQAHATDPQTPPPGFLQPNQDAAQTTLQQQQERSQALAVEQLGALMKAYRAVGTGALQR